MKEKIGVCVSICCFNQVSVYQNLTALIKPLSKEVALAGVKLFHPSKWVVKGFKALKISSYFLSAIQERLEELSGCCWEKFHQKQSALLLQNNTVNTVN